MCEGKKEKDKSFLFLVFQRKNGIEFRKQSQRMSTKEGKLNVPQVCIYRFFFKLVRLFLKNKSLIKICHFSCWYIKTNLFIFTTLKENLE
jgi:hypothetical protein